MRFLEPEIWLALPVAVLVVQQVLQVEQWNVGSTLSAIASVERLMPPKMQHQASAERRAGPQTARVVRSGKVLMPRVVQ